MMQHQRKLTMTGMTVTPGNGTHRFSACRVLSNTYTQQSEKSPQTLLIWRKVWTGLFVLLLCQINGTWQVTQNSKQSRQPTRKFFNTVLVNEMPKTYSVFSVLLSTGQKIHHTLGSDQQLQNCRIPSSEQL